MRGLDLLGSGSFSWRGPRLFSAVSTGYAVLVFRASITTRLRLSVLVASEFGSTESYNITRNASRGGIFPVVCFFIKHPISNYLRIG